MSIFTKAPWVPAFTATSPYTDEQIASFRRQNMIWMVALYGTILFAGWKFIGKKVVA